MRSSAASSHWPCPPGFNGRLAGLYRFLSGRPLNGHRYTDATFLRYGTMATDLSGHASTYQLWPGWKRLAFVRLPLLATPFLAMATAIGLATAMWPTTMAMAIVAILAMAIVAKRFVAMARVRGHRKNVIEPLATAVAKVLAKRYVRGHGHEWVDVPLDIRDNPDAVVAIRIPPGWPGDKGDRERVAKVVAGRLAMTDIVATWDMTGAAPMATFGQQERPVAKLDFEELATVAIPDTDLAMGGGIRRKLVTFSLALDSPHLLIAAASGAGKSELLAWLMGQFMRRGYGLLVLDAKYVSHMWARRIPGVLYASEDEELHDGLIWLDDELRRRARFVAAGGEPETLVPLVAVLEEMTGASNRLRAYWRTIKVQGDPMMSPALTALANLSSMGREMRVHILMAGQSLTAKASGGAENRENFGGRCLARATRQQWQMLAPQIKPAPLKKNAPGRWHLVVGDELLEFQAPFMDIKGRPERLIEWATGGAAVPDVPAMMLVGGTGLDQGISRNAPPPPSAASLREYASERPGLELATLLRWRERQSTFPDAVGEGARGVKLYERSDLDAFVAVRLQETAGDIS